ncbi:hypothetical protein RND71_026680 [Anisodus tanguticus]|uniref:Uncharacterized protein n=1 Tax=Anisodus tanguticus TaxID=243964 RepID=A0AAE1RP31_9SOLA|nr:hypothetical protein RND71_026680 [Anisodus tanguticus]
MRMSKNITPARPISVDDVLEKLIKLRRKYQTKMEQNLPVVAKKFWKIVKVALCMLRKGISKQKIMLDIKLMMKRSKISSYKSAIQNLMFHFHHNHNRHYNVDSNLPFSPREDEYEFSCSSSPNLNKNTEEEDVIVMNAAVMKALEMIKAETASQKAVQCTEHGALAESEKRPHSKECDVDSLPSLPDNYLCGFGRQLRVTDSPFPVRDEVEESDNHVDKAADEFIFKFYRNLRRQSSLSAS